MIEGSAIPADNKLIWVGDMVRQASKTCPDRQAIVMPEHDLTLTYRELELSIDRALFLLREQGLQAGDRFAYLGKNHALFYVLLFAAIRGGFIMAPLNWRCVAAEVNYFLEDSGAVLLFRDPEFATVADEAIAPLLSSPKVLSTSRDEGERSEFVRQLEQLDNVVSEENTQKDSICLLLYTSGTSGRPKGVLSSHLALSESRRAELVCETYPKWEGGTIVSSMPHFHIAGIAWMHIGLIRQSTCVLTTDPSGANLTRLIRDYEAVATFAVPTVVRTILEEIKRSGQKLHSLKYIFYGSAPIGESLLRSCMEVLGCGFGQYYGMTEITGSATFLDPDSHSLERPELMQSVGRPLPGVALDIRDSDGRSLPPGTPGEIWIRTPTLMKEYLNKPEETEKAVADGWYRTGDGGYLTEEGYLFLTDRLKDIIVSGGENIYPAEVEEAVRQYPPVLDVAVVSRPDEHWGEAVMAVVEPRPGESIDIKGLVDFVRTKIAGYKCPKTVVVMEQLPRTASGKVQRGKARDAALQLLEASDQGTAK